MLEVELFAIAAGVEGDSGVGQIQHDMALTTETNHLYLPISAIVLTAHEYEHSPVVERAGGKLAPGVKCVSNRPRSTQCIIRPRKQNTGKSHFTLFNNLMPIIYFSTSFCTLL